MTVRREELRRALAERVARKVEGHHIDRRVVDATVDRVVAALAAGDATAASATDSPPRAPTLLAAVSARTMPDLASRLRAALEREGVRDVELGRASAGRHSVVTVRAPAAAREALERIAARDGLSLSFLDAGAQA